jgi:hypothetical protein
VVEAYRSNKVIDKNNLKKHWPYNQRYTLCFLVFTVQPQYGKRKWLTKNRRKLLKNKAIFYPVDLHQHWANLGSSSTGTAQLPGR